MIQPSIIFTQGDTVVLNLTAQDNSGNPVDLTGASFTTFIRGSEGENIEFLNSQHTANPDQVNNKGQFTLSLSSGDTESCPVNPGKEIITLIEIGSTQVYYHGPGILTVLSANPQK